MPFLGKYWEITDFLSVALLCFSGQVSLSFLVAASLKQQISLNHAHVSGPEGSLFT